MNRSQITICAKELIRYICVWILFVITIFLAFWVNNPTYYIKCDYTSEVCNAINNITLSLSLSYIAGFIFFFLSEFVPTIKKKCEDESRIAFYLNNLTRDYYGFFNFSADTDNYKRGSFEEVSQSLFQEDVSKYCKTLKLSLEDGECDIDVHFKAEVLLNLEFNANIIRETLIIFQMLSYKLPFPVIDILGRIKSSRILLEIGERRGFRDSFAEEELKIRLALYKEMMIEYNDLVNKLINITNNHNKNYTQYKIWQI